MTYGDRKKSFYFKDLKPLQNQEVTRVQKFFQRTSVNLTRGELAYLVRAAGSPGADPSKINDLREYANFQRTSAQVATKKLL